ncbi:cupin domain-containing protein [Polymorphobacter fuscus]|uniref:Cupin domain-containing protein n=1 Tax=Sandarakinorhabdus fusca TaxID=1439888 RepID=A0A7C9GZL5_9SPHN|nr:cupin domain-containing protein [Polymorphobacter fuscus]KAB7643631.1 cupin domain-containing protein [Polymorphobacter fuscus]MQT18714.1 cupin domain-containing protein [Polymorphobacter fuscus]NJC09602.1 mannose-6-phosphate isomerase-like protein (cupin superfamily) [Polymorphobacter fuscus]
MIALVLAALLAGAPMVVVDERDTLVREAPPHGGQGMSSAWRISDKAPGRSMEFRKRGLDKGASIGLHVLGHDEVYYAVSGTGRVTSDGVERPLAPGMAAYLYTGANVGIVQTGDEPLVLIIAYPVVR